DEKIIIATFKVVDESDCQPLLDDSHDDLKRSDDSSTPVFHNYNAKALKKDETLRSVFVTDIPLFLTASDVKASFAKYGTIVKFNLRTPHNSKFQKATITFTDASVVTNYWFQKWYIWCKCQCLRVYPATFSKIDMDQRLQFTAVLRNLPPNLDA